MRFVYITISLLSVKIMKHKDIPSTEELVTISITALYCLKGQLYHYCIYCTFWQEHKPTMEENIENAINQTPPV